MLIQEILHINKMIIYLQRT